MKAKTARAYGFASGGHGAYVLVFSSKEIDCKTLLSGQRQVAADEDYVDVGWGPQPSAQQFVTSQNEMAQVTTQIAREPRKPGDPIEVCVRAPVILHTTMVKTSTIDVVGLMKATYCGEVK